MTLPELSPTLVAPLILTDIQIAKSFVNDIPIYEYSYFQQEFTDATRVRAYLMECDLDGEPITADSATLLVKVGGATVGNSTITISTSDDETITDAIEVLISAP